MIDAGGADRRPFCAAGATDRNCWRGAPADHMAAAENYWSHEPTTAEAQDGQGCLAVNDEQESKEIDNDSMTQ